MTRSSAVLTIAALALSTAACDRTTSLALTPEVEESTSFESGLDGWTVDRQLGSTGGGMIVAGEASEGASYLQLTLDATTDFVWIERVFTLQPDTEYSVTISADIRAFEGSADIRLGARGTDTDGSGFDSDGPTLDQWTRTISPQPVTTDAQGRAWVAVGVRGVDSTGTFGVDRLTTSFIRTGEAS